MSYLFSGFFGKKNEEPPQAQQIEDQKQQPQAQESQSSVKEQPQQDQKDDAKISSNSPSRSTQDLNSSQTVTAKPTEKAKSENLAPKKNDTGDAEYNPPSIFLGLATKPPQAANPQPTSSSAQSSQQLNTSQGSIQIKSNQGANTAGVDIFSGLGLSSTQAQAKPQAQQQQAQPMNSLFAGLSFAPKPQVQQQQDKPQSNQQSVDIFGNLSLKSNSGSSSQQFQNPYANKGGEYSSTQSYLQGPAFQTPSNLIETTLQHQPQQSKLSKDDPFYGLVFNPAPSILTSTQQQVNQNTSSSSGSIFQFLNTGSTNNNNNQAQKTNTTEQKEIGDISVSSINNVSKNSFEEVEKVDHQKNYYLSKPPGMSANTTNSNLINLMQSTQHQPQSMQQQQQQDTQSQLFFLKQSQQQNSQQPQALVNNPNLVNTSVGNFDVDKSIKDDNFEEITESKDIIEDRIYKIKNVMIDYSMKQQDLSEKIQNLQKDVELLQTKLEDTISQQQKAIENEDYEEADQLNMRITQAKNLIQSKESMIKKFDDDHMSLENKKSDKFRELSTLLHRSLEKMNELKDKQNLEMQQFEESEQNAIEEKRKRLHYESIRIDEIKKEVNDRKNKINSKLQLIEEQVYEDTRPQQQEKSTIEIKIDKIDKEIEEIEALLERKKKERDQLYTDKQVFEKEIDKSRSKYRDQILRLERELEKIQKDEDKNTKDLEDQKRELLDLQDYQETYKMRLEGFHKELKELEEFEKQLKKSCELIDNTLQEKESCKDKTFMIKQEINQLKIKRDNAAANKEYTNEKQAKIDAEIEDLQQQINNFEKKIQKQEQDKKKAALAKKFKEASKAQAEIKEFTTQMEEAQGKLQDFQMEKDSIEKEIAKKDEEISVYEKQLRTSQVQYEKEQLKLLTYRKEDILDLLQSLKNMHNVNNAKKKTESLENELLKIDNELFELEKKYGEFKIKKVQQSQQNIVEQSPHSMKSNEEQQIIENMPEVESSRMNKEEELKKASSAEIVEEQVISEKDIDEIVDAKPKRSKNEIRAEIAQQEDKIRDLEAQIDQAAESEDYEKADALQTEIDNIQQNLIPHLREELMNAAEDDEINVDYGRENGVAGSYQSPLQVEEEYSPPMLDIQLNEVPPLYPFKEEVQSNVEAEIQIEENKEESVAAIDNSQQQTPEGTITNIDNQIQQENPEPQQPEQQEITLNQQELVQQQQQPQSEEVPQEEAVKEVVDDEDQNKEPEEVSTYNPPPLDLFSGLSQK